MKLYMTILGLSILLFTILIKTAPEATGECDDCGGCMGGTKEGNKDGQ